MENIKTVIFCGGRGTRIREMTEFIPKPMVLIGGKPILWHIMKIYGSHGVNKFIFTLGYKGESIRNYFVNYKHMLHDYTFRLRTGELEIHDDHVDDWNITFCDTGENTETGERLHRVKKFLEGEKRFMVTYGDGVANIDIKKLMDFHLKHGKLVTVAGGHGHHKYGLLNIDTSGRVLSFSQKPRLPDYINIGFMVLEHAVFEYLQPGKPIEDTLAVLAEKGELMMYPHEGFFHPMDTYKDYEDLNQLWKERKPWMVWK